MRISLQVKFRKLANLAMASEFGNALAKLARRLRIWQGDCEFGKVVAKLARLFAKLARLRIGCQQCAKILFCCSSIHLVMSSTASHFFHFSFVFPLNFGLVDG